MARSKASNKPGDSTRTALLEAAEKCVQMRGYRGLRTRRIAEAAGVPVSQIHYHFASKEALVFALLERQNRRLLDRQRTMFAADLPLWKRWDKACDYLKEDLASGYVRALLEAIAVGWGNPEIAKAVRTILLEWLSLLVDLAREATARFGSLNGLKAEELGCLIGGAFLGAEALLLLGFEEKRLPIRRALRRIGTVIRRLEERPAPSSVAAAS
jgi:AcrR family transcriptional regulator